MPAPALTEPVRTEPVRTEPVPPDPADPAPPQPDPAPPVPALRDLAAAVGAALGLPAPVGLGARAELSAHIDALAAAVARLQTGLALRMAALEREGARVCDVRGQTARAGLSAALAAALRRTGLFADQHPDVAAAWQDRTITLEQVDAVRGGAAKLPTAELRRDLIEALLPELPGLGARATRALVGWAVDHLAPGDPDAAEHAEHAARRLSWSQVPGGGIVLDGYLPAAEAGALTAAIDAMAASMRVADDGCTPAQRRADALAAIIAVANRHGLPTGGGVPATLTLTVPLTEAARIAARDPNVPGTGRPRPHGGATIDGAPAGDAAVRFALCCAAITPLLTDQQPDRDDGGPLVPGSLLHRIAGTGTMPLAVGRAVRLATTAQRTALRQRDGGCAIPGCDVPAPYTEPHHVTAWSLDGPTDLDNLVSLCFVHHRLTELGQFVFHRRSPDDPTPPNALTHPLYWIIPRPPA